MSVLAAGFGLWSAFTGPKIAEVAVHQAAADTVNAPSFVATMYISVAREPDGLSQGGTIVESVDYEAPDRVFSSTTVKEGAETSRATTTQIGSSCWESDPADAGPCQASAIPQFLKVLSDLEKVHGVSFENGTYVLSSSEGRKYLIKSFGSSSSSSAQALSGVHVKIRLTGDRISTVAFTEAGTSFKMKFSQVGSAPPVVRPSGSPSS